MTTGVERSEIKLKLITLGNSAAGKSSLLMKYFDNIFSNTYITTIGIDFKVKTLTIDDKTYKFSIWDTAGQERFRTITFSYVRNVNGILLLFDVSDRKSFLSVSQWMKDIYDIDKSFQIFLIGNKIDRVAERQVSYEEAKEFADTRKIDYYEISCKRGTNVKETMDTILHKVARMYSPSIKTKSGGGEEVSIASTKFGMKKCC